MLRNFQSSISKLMTREFGIGVIFGILVIIMYYYYVQKTSLFDGFESDKTDKMDMSGIENAKPTKSQVEMIREKNVGTGSGSETATESFESSEMFSSQTVASPQDLLPKDQNSKWSELNPTGQGNIMAPDLLQAGYHIGLDTIGQTMRNANLQERSDPIIPKSVVGPWNQSTIEPDLGRVPLEVGAGTR